MSHASVPSAPPRQQAIESSPDLAHGKTAFAIENDAYTSSASRVRLDHKPYVSGARLTTTQREYEAACDAAQRPQSEATARHQDEVTAEQSDPPGHDVLQHPAQRFGSYENCHYIASGVTAEVYRCKDRALKVITETHNIEPHNPAREAKILSLLRPPCIPLLETFRDQEQRFTLVFPYMPLTLAGLLEQGILASAQIRVLFTDVLGALQAIHAQGIIHRDVKPHAVLLASPDGPAYLSDFGTAWHPDLSASSEPPAAKILDIGTGPYRAPEVLFGDRSYGTAVDMWAAGCMLAECARRPPRPLFESRAVHEDGNQLGLILSIFKTIGSPTRESWPEAQAFRTPPFDFYQAFEGRPWSEILDGVDEGWADMIQKMVRYDSGRMTAEEVSICPPPLFLLLSFSILSFSSLLD